MNKFPELSELNLFLKFQKQEMLLNLMNLPKEFKYNLKKVKNGLFQLYNIIYQKLKLTNIMKLSAFYPITTNILMFKNGKNQMYNYQKLFKN